MTGLLLCMSLICFGPSDTFLVKYHEADDYNYEHLEIYYTSDNKILAYDNAVWLRMECNNR